MAANPIIKRLSGIERLNFLLTNRIPRRWATLFMGRFSRIENPVVCRLSVAVWRMFSDDLTLQEAKKTAFTSLHDCFTRELKAGARPIDPDPAVVVSPCDAIVGASGLVRDGRVIQAKGFPYTLADLLGDETLASRYRYGVFVTLRLKSSMYHRFYAPCDCTLSRVDYISGDTWNVNPVALKRVERLFCKNERAVITLVPVAAILVASIRRDIFEWPAKERCLALESSSRDRNRVTSKSAAPMGTRTTAAYVSMQTPDDRTGLGSLLVNH